MDGLKQLPKPAQALLEAERPAHSGACQMAHDVGHEKVRIAAALFGSIDFSS